MHIAHHTTSLAAGVLLALTPAVLAQFSPASLIEGPDSLEAPPAEFAAALCEERAMLGVMLDVEDGTPVISSVMEESPAARAGLQSGDRITAVGDTPVASLEDLQGLLGGLSVGDEVVIGYERDGSEGTKTVLLAAMESFETEAAIEIEFSPEVQTDGKLRFLTQAKPKQKKHKLSNKSRRILKVKLKPETGIDLEDGIHTLSDCLVLDTSAGAEDPSCCEGGGQGELSFVLSQVDGGQLSVRLKAAGIEGEQIARALAEVGKACIRTRVEETSDCDCCPDCQSGPQGEPQQATRKIMFGSGGASGTFFFDSDEHGEEGHGNECHGERHEFIIEGLPEGHTGSWFEGAEGHLGETHHGNGEHHKVNLERIHFGEGHGSAPHGSCHENVEFHRAHGEGHWTPEAPHHEAPHQGGDNHWFSGPGQGATNPHEAHNPLMDAREELRALRTEMRELRAEMRALREMARQHGRRR